MQEKPIDRWLALAGVAVGLILFLVPRSSVSVSVCAAMLFALLLHPIWNMWWIEAALSRRLFALGLWSLCCAFVGFVAWPSAQSVDLRVQVMFSSDRAKPLSSLYAVLSLDRVHEPPDLADFCVVVAAYRSFGGNRGEQAIGLVARTTTGVPFGVTHPIPGMRITSMSAAPTEVRTDNFIYNYYWGLNRIELGVYPGSNINDKIRTMDDLDGALIAISVTEPVSAYVKRVSVVANSYVIVDLASSDLKWRASRSEDFWGLPIERALVARSRTMDAEGLTNLSLADVIARRRRRVYNEAPGSFVQFNVGSFPKPEHGWLISDSQFKQW